MPQAIGVFDSGLGGLGSVRELCRICPEEDIVYFGDTARLPYGSRSFETICHYAAQDAAFLLSQNVKAILIACGTVSSIALPTLQKTVSVPVVGIVEPAAKAAISATKNGKIGVLGTQATIGSGTYEKTLRFLSGGDAVVTSVACPLLVPIAENGQSDSELARLALQTYLETPLAMGCDTLLLGCTHYPLFTDLIHELAPGITLIDSARAGAAALSDILQKNRISGGGSGKLTLYTSDFSQGFAEQAALFLQDPDASFVREKVQIDLWD